ncbi:hypothetical protein QQS21_007659 [Conoideocrella luteorostrata]|uniref:Uncharacterized protein n=1 Tax=Conoideocrella luteorostrata TaxID=1105319 RepID=A0AAJ0CN46_9HYPO|nr:hypothetical protein QQS21_007659 [Conoideocrella luteorostrata]
MDDEMFVEADNAANDELDETYEEFEEIEGDIGDIEVFTDIEEGRKGMFEGTNKEAWERTWEEAMMRQMADVSAKKSNYDLVVVTHDDQPLPPLLEAHWLCHEESLRTLT